MARGRCRQCCCRVAPCRSGRLSRVCALALQMAVDAAPERILAAAADHAASGRAAKQLTVRGVALGKKSASPAVSKVRMLLPPGAWMELLDALLAAARHHVVDSLPPVRGFCECAVSGRESSASYLAHSSRLLIEGVRLCVSWVPRVHRHKNVLRPHRRCHCSYVSAVLWPTCGARRRNRQTPATCTH